MIRRALFAPPESESHPRPTDGMALHGLDQFSDSRRPQAVLVRALIRTRITWHSTGVWYFRIVITRAIDITRARGAIGCESLIISA